MCLSDLLVLYTGGSSENRTVRQISGRGPSTSSVRARFRAAHSLSWKKCRDATRRGRLDGVLFYFGNSRRAHQRLAAAVQPHPSDHFHPGMARVRAQTGSCHDAQQEALFMQRIDLHHQRPPSRPQHLRHI
jgi:hypothetical protein